MAEDMWVRVQIFIGNEPFSISEKKTSEKTYSITNSKKETEKNY